jgi:RimJ/RimL family protein N-acetyltransferase
VSHGIETQRLKLVTLGPALLRALLTGETAAAEALLRARVPEAWPSGLSKVFRLRLGQLEAAPAEEPWLLRAVVLRSEARVIGVTGFHGRPGGAWLRDHAPDGVEFGYTIFESYRRQGYATEASEGLIRWATAEHAVRRYLLSIGPDNDASQRVARKLGFRQVGAWEHPQRGHELVYLLMLGESRLPTAEGMRDVSMDSARLRLAARRPTLESTS